MNPLNEASVNRRQALQLGAGAVLALQNPELFSQILPSIGIDSNLKELGEADGTTRLIDASRMILKMRGVKLKKGPEDSFRHATDYIPTGKENALFEVSLSEVIAGPQPHQLFDMIYYPYGIERDSSINLVATTSERVLKLFNFFGHSFNFPDDPTLLPGHLSLDDYYEILGRISTAVPDPGFLRAAMFEGHFFGRDSELGDRVRKAFRISEMEGVHDTFEAIARGMGFAQTGDVEYKPLGQSLNAIQNVTDAVSDADRIYQSVTKGFTDVFGLYSGDPANEVEMLDAETAEGIFLPEGELAADKVDSLRDDELESLESGEVSVFDVNSLPDVVAEIPPKTFARFPWRKNTVNKS